MKTSFHSMWDFKKNYNTDLYLDHEHNKNKACISIITSPEEIFKLSPKWADSLQLMFDDTDNIENPRIFNEQMASQILEFISNNINRTEIVVHCFMGVSRSAAISLFIQEEILQKKVEDIQRSPYSGYNRHVTKLLRAQLYK